jgi:hypothetical protein
MGSIILQHLDDGVDPLPDGPGPVMKLGFHSCPLLLDLSDCVRVITRTQSESRLASVG